MIKSNIRRGILTAVLTGGLALSAVRAFALDNTVLLTGTVAPINTVVVTPTGNTFPVTNAGFTATEVATVVETSNDTAGYDVTLLSTSTDTGGTTAFQLKSDANPTVTPITYTVGYGTSGQTAATITTPGVGVNVTNVSAPTAPTGAGKAIKIAVASGTYNAAADYKDTITLTITGK